MSPVEVPCCELIYKVFVDDRYVLSHEQTILEGMALLNISLSFIQMIDQRDPRYSTLFTIPDLSITNSQSTNHRLWSTATNPCTSNPTMTHRQARSPVKSINPLHPNLTRPPLPFSPTGSLRSARRARRLGCVPSPGPIDPSFGIDFWRFGHRDAALHTRGVLELLSRRY
jgi:hypothetical protein